MVEKGAPPTATTVADVPVDIDSFTQSLQQDNEDV